MNKPALSPLKEEQISRSPTLKSLQWAARKTESQPGHSHNFDLGLLPTLLHMPLIFPLQTSGFECKTVVTHERNVVFVRIIISVLCSPRVAAKTELTG